MSFSRSLFILSLILGGMVFLLFGTAHARERPSWDSFSSEYAGVGVGYRAGVRFFRDVSADLEGGDPTPSFSVKVGTSLPAGLQLTGTGYLVGVPTAAGVSKFTIVASNASGIAEKRVTLHIREPFGDTTYGQGEVHSSILDAQVFLNSTDCPVAASGVGSPGKEVLSFTPALKQATTCYQQLHSLPATATLTPALLQHFIQTYTGRFIPGDFTLPPGTVPLSSPLWSDDRVTYTTFSNAPVTRDLSDSLVRGYPSPSFSVQAGTALPIGLSLSDFGIISGTPTTPTTADTTIVATNSSGSASFRIAWTVREGGYSLGSTHPDVRQAQVYLNGTPCPIASTGSGSPGQETSYFGTKTRQALNCYQRLHSLPVTNTITPTLLTHLSRHYTPPALNRPQEVSTPLQSPLDPPPAPAVVPQDGVCDITVSQGCAVGTPVQHEPSYISLGERWRCRGVNNGFSSDWCVRCDDGYSFDGRNCSRSTAQGSPGLRCSGTTVSFCRLPRSAHGNTVAGACSTGRIGSCEYACRDGIWTAVANSCTKPSPCVGSTVAGCVLQDTRHDTLTDGSCADGSTGACRYRCTNSVWKAVSNTCARACVDGTFSGCAVDAASHDAVGGSCTAGYTGSCAYRCTDGIWSRVSNTCSVIPVVESQRRSCIEGIFSGCALDTTSHSAVDGSCAVGYVGSCAYRCADGSWSQVSNTCSAISPVMTQEQLPGPSLGCSANVFSHCALDAVSHRAVAGSCERGYTGSCQYACGNGEWNFVSNTCTRQASLAQRVITPIVSTVSRLVGGGGSTNGEGGVSNDGGYVRKNTACLGQQSVDGVCDGQGGCSSGKRRDPGGSYWTHGSCSDGNIERSYSCIGQCGGSDASCSGTTVCDLGCSYGYALDGETSSPRCNNCASDSDCRTGTFCERGRCIIGVGARGIPTFRIDRLDELRQCGCDTYDAFCSNNRCTFCSCSIFDVTKKEYKSTGKLCSVTSDCSGASEVAGVTWDSEGCHCQHSHADGSFHGNNTQHGTDAQGNRVDSECTGWCSPGPCYESGGMYGCQVECEDGIVTKSSGCKSRDGAWCGGGGLVGTRCSRAAGSETLTAKTPPKVVDRTKTTTTGTDTGGGAGTTGDERRPDTGNGGTIGGTGGETTLDCSSRSSCPCPQNDWCSSGQVGTCSCVPNSDGSRCIQSRSLTPCPQGQNCSNGSCTGGGGTGGETTLDCSSRSSCPCPQNDWCSSGQVGTCSCVPNSDGSRCIQSRSLTPCPQGQNCSNGSCTSSGGGNADCPTTIESCRCHGISLFGGCIGTYWERVRLCNGDALSRKCGSSTTKKKKATTKVRAPDNPPKGPEPIQNVPAPERAAQKAPVQTTTQRAPVPVDDTPPCSSNECGCSNTGTWCHGGSSERSCYCAVSNGSCVKKYSTSSCASGVCSGGSCTSAGDTPNSYPPKSYSPKSYSPRSYSPRSYSPRSYSPRSYSPRSYSPRSYSPRSYPSADYGECCHRGHCHTRSRSYADGDRSCEHKND